MPRIESLKLLRFRSWPKAELRFVPGMTALVGANGAGKTNLLEALSLLTAGRGLRRAKPEALAHRADPLGWRLQARLDDATEIDILASVGQSRQVRVDEARTSQLSLSMMMRQLWLTPAMDRLWADSPEDRRRFLDRVTLAFFPSHGDEVLGYERAMRERNRLLREGRVDPSWLGALEGQMAEHGAAITAARLETLERIHEAQAQRVTAFPAAALRLVEAEGRSPTTDAETLRQRLLAGRMRDGEAGRSLSGPHRADLEADYQTKAMPAALCSTGEQKGMMIAVLLAAAKALGASGALPLLLLDEVAAHFDADRRAELFAEIAALDCQAVMTGTGAELFSALPADATIVNVTETGGQSQIETAPPVHRP